MARSSLQSLLLVDVKYPSTLGFLQFLKVKKREGVYCKIHLWNLKIFNIQCQWRLISSSSCLFVESSGTFLNKICNSLLPIPDLNLFRRTLSAVLCDNVPLNSKSKQKLRFPENAFKIEQATKNLNCQDIIRERHLNFEEIAQEIVNSFGNQISTKRNI